MKNKNEKQSKQNGPGRPKYTPVYPRTKEWTFTDWMGANGIDINPDSKDFGKGPNCTMLTLRKAMERDMYFHKTGKRIVAANRTTANPRSLMLMVRGVTAEPNSESGLGRRATLYCLRAKGASVKNATVAPKTSAKPATVKTSAPKSKTSTKSQTPTADALDKIHAALAAPEPAPAAVTIPAVTIAPPVVEAAPAPEVVPVVEVPAPAPEVAPVAETPVPAAPVTETAPVAS